MKEKKLKKIRRGISEIEFQITSHKSKVDELNLTMQKSTGLEQENLTKK